MNSSSMEVGPIGIWTAQFDYQPAAKARSCRGTRTARVRSDLVPRKCGPGIAHACGVTSRRNQPHSHCHKESQIFTPAIR